MENDPDSPESDFEAPDQQPKPAQIPLLDDVVLNTELPFAKPNLTPRASLQSAATKRAGEAENLNPASNEKIPRPTDLFGGSPETAQSGPMSPHYEAKDLDEAAQKMRQDTEQVVDNLVAEYSQEIIARLQTELTALLDDLNQSDPPQKD